MLSVRGSPRTESITDHAESESGLELSGTLIVDFGPS
jgi:hypothetical protein